MSGQPDKAVPLLAGEAFCEKPPLTYWVAAAAIDAFGGPRAHASPIFSMRSSPHSVSDCWRDAARGPSRGWSRSSDQHVPPLLPG